MLESHYVRSLCGLLMISDIIDMLRWEAFWQEKDRHDFTDVISLLENLKEAMQDHNAKESAAIIMQCKESVRPLQEEFKKFCEHCTKNSEVCKYLHILKVNIDYLKGLIAADLSGNWILHFKSVENLLPLLAEYDSINYLHYGSLYLELMNHLPVEHPHIYEDFLQGHFVVKTSPGNFNAVAANMKFEQTIQRS